MAHGHGPHPLGHGADHHHTEFPLAGRASARHRRGAAGAGLPHPAAGERPPPLGLSSVAAGAGHPLRGRCACRPAGGCGEHPRLRPHPGDAGAVRLPLARYGGRVPRRRSRKARRPRRRGYGRVLRGADGAGADRAGGLAAGAAAAGALSLPAAQHGQAVPLPDGHRLRHHRRAGAPVGQRGAVGRAGRAAGGGTAGHVPRPALSHGLATPAGRPAGRCHPPVPAGQGLPVLCPR